MSTDYEKDLREGAKQMPAAAIRQMELVLKKIFKEKGIPYNIESLKACIVMCELFHPQIPPMYSEFVASSMLLMYALIGELETGMVVSSNLIIPKGNNEQHPPKTEGGNKG